MAKKLEVVITGNTRGLSNAFGDAERKAGGFGNKMGAVGAKVGKALAVASAVGVAAVGAIGVGLYKVGAQFDDAYDKIRVGTGKTGAVLEGLKYDFKAVVADVPADFGDASTAIADLNARLGLTGTPLQDLSKQFLELSRITDTDVATNVDNLTRVFGDWQISAADMPATLDKVFRASQVSGIGIDDLSTSVVKFGAPLRNLGFTFDDSLALLAQFNKSGVNTQTVFAGLKAGVGKLAKAGENVPTTFRRVVDEIRKLGPGSKATAKAIELFGQRAGPDLADAITGGKFKVDELMKSITGGSDTIMKAGKDTQDFSEKWKLLKNKVLVGLEPLATSVFGAVGKAIDKITPTVTKAVGGFRAFVAAFQHADDGITSSGFAGWLEGLGIKARRAFDAIAKAWPRIRKDLVEGAKAVGRALQALVDKFRPVVGAVVDFVKANPKPVLIGLATALGVVTAAWAVMAIAEAAALWPIYLIIAAIAVVAGGLVYAYQKVGWFHDAVDAVASFLKNTLWPILQDVAKVVVEKLVVAFQWTSQFITGTLIPGLQAMWSWFQDKILPTLSAVAGWLATNIPVAFQAAVDATGWLIEKGTVLYSLFQTYILPTLQTVASNLVGPMVDALQSVVGWFGRIIEKGTVLYSLFSTYVLPTLQDIATFLVDVFKVAVKVAADGMTWFISRAKSVWHWLDKIKTLAGDVGGALKGALNTGTGGIAGGLLGFADGGTPPVGVPYLVGERGPEVRIDKRPGVIIPNHKITMPSTSANPALGASVGSSVSAPIYNITVNVQGSVHATDDLADALVDTLNKRARSTGRSPLITTTSSPPGMTWDPPSYTLNVALDSPQFSPGTYTDLSSRIRSNIVWRKGRGDTRSAFDPAVFTVELDNGDRMLDPLNPSGLVYTADGLGLPLCPVTVDVTFAGVTSRLFTGYLGPTCWEGGTRSIDSTVTFQAQGLLACSPSMPADQWHIMTAAMYPDWWLPMDVGFPVLDDGSLVPNRSGVGGNADVEGGVGDLGRVAPTTVYKGSPAQPSLKWSPGMVLRSNAADIMPNGDELNMTGWLFWAATTPLTTGQYAVVASMTEAGTGDVRWAIYVDDAGVAQVETYDAAGAPVDTATVTPTYTSRWDDGAGHLVVWRFTSGNNMDVWFGGDHVSLTATSTVYESDLAIGPSDVDTITDEVTVWRRSLTDAEVAGAILAAGGVTTPWHGDSWADRLGHLFDAAHSPVTFDQTSEWHVPGDDPDDAFWGLGIGEGFSAAGGVLAKNLVATVEDGMGVVWDTRAGFLRCRTIHALTDPTYAANYATTAASFTDEDTSLPAGTYRHAGVEQSGPSIDTVINRAAVTFVYLSDPVLLYGFPATIAPQDDASVYGPTGAGGYGVRQENYTISRWGWTAAATLADTVVDRYSQPVAQIDTLHLDATGNDDLTAWLCASLELELAVDVTYTPFGADPVTYETLNIQSIDWRQTADGKLLVDLGVGRS